jgi:phosphatidate cytidylyltransferase
VTNSVLPSGAGEPSAGLRLGNLTQRLLTAAVGIPVVVAAVWAGGWWLTGVVAAAAGIGVLEVQGARHHLGSPVALLAGGLAALLPVSAKLGFGDAGWAFALVAAAPLAALALARDPREGVVDWLWAVGPVLYVGWLAAHFVLLRGVADGRDWVLLAVLTVWTTDTGAYFVGRPLGRHKLAPRISPGKTWEGAAGGQVAGFAAVAGLAAAFGLDLTAAHVVALGLLLPAAAQLGDLAESAVKRGLGVKDSSGLVPGHGGVLDRLDSLLFAAPVLYWYLRWLVQ